MPDYLLLNYLSCPLTITDKDSRKNSNKDISTENNIVQIPTGSADKPSASPIIVSTYNTKKNLYIKIPNNEEPVKYKIDHASPQIEIENYNSVANQIGALAKQKILCSSRINGTIRVIEIRHPSGDRQNTVGRSEMPREERKNELIKKVRKRVGELDDDEAQSKILIQ